MPVQARSATDRASWLASRPCGLRTGLNSKAHDLRQLISSSFCGAAYFAVCCDSQRSDGSQRASRWRPLNPQAERRRGIGPGCHACLTLCGMPVSGRDAACRASCHYGSAGTAGGQPNGGCPGPFNGLMEQRTGGQLFTLNSQCDTGIRVPA